MCITASMAAFSVIGHAQSVTPEVIATAGQQYQNGALQLEWTLGEVITESQSNGNETLTQGFHQPEMKVTGLEDFHTGLELSVFPNPSTGILHVAFDAQPRALHFALNDATGQTLIRRQATQGFELDLFSLAPGSYFLSVRSHNGTLYKTYQILKTN